MVLVAGEESGRNPDGSDAESQSRYSLSPPLPCWFPQGEKTLTLLGGGGSMGVVTFLEAPLWGDRGVWVLPSY